MNVNIVVLEGTIVGEDAKQIANGRGMMFSLCVPENRMDKKGEWQTEFNYFDVVDWNENHAKNTGKFPKGARVLVSGRLKQRKYEAKDGSKRNIVQIVANMVKTLDKIEEGPDKHATVEEYDNEAIPF